MDVAAALEFVRQNHRAVLATSRRDGSPQLSPVVAGVDGDTVVVSTREPSAKVRNLRRNPTGSLLVLADSFFGRWVQVDGSIEIRALPGAMDGLVNYYRMLSGEHPDWDDYRAKMVAEERVLLCLTVERAGPN